MKRFIILILILLITISLAGCNSDSLADYKKAAEKTDQITKGQTSGDITLEMEFNTEGMTAEKINDLNYFKELDGSFNVMYDTDAEKSIFRNYLSFGGLGFDFDLFVNSDEIFIKLPVVGKYMNLDEMQSTLGKEQKFDGSSEMISEDSLEEMASKWLGLMKKEDVFKGKDIVLTTPDGEVKTTIYTIKLSDNQIKSMASESIDILSKDEKFVKTVKDILSNTEQLKEESIEDIITNMKENINVYTVEDFNYTAYVDIDGYIVNEKIEVELKNDNAEKGCPTHLSYRVDIKNWDINKEQQFNFPLLTEENTIKEDEMNGTLPDMFENLIRDEN